MPRGKPLESQNFSVRADENFQAIRIGEDTRRRYANEYLEREIQRFLDQHPNIRIQHVQFSTIAIIPKTATWQTTNAGIDWKMEKAVLVFCQEDAHQ
jgi:hypothetical protein